MCQLLFKCSCHFVFNTTFLKQIMSPFHKFNIEKHVMLKFFLSLSLHELIMLCNFKQIIFITFFDLWWRVIPNLFANYRSHDKN